MFVAETIKATKQKYLLFGPLQAGLANPWTKPTKSLLWPNGPYTICQGCCCGYMYHTPLLCLSSRGGLAFAWKYSKTPLPQDLCTGLGSRKRLAAVERLEVPHPEHGPGDWHDYGGRPVVKIYLTEICVPRKPEILLLGSPQQVLTCTHQEAVLTAASSQPRTQKTTNKQKPKWVITIRINR